MISQQRLAGQQSQLAGQAPLAAHTPVTPVQTMARDALQSFAQVNNSYQVPLMSHPQFQAGQVSEQAVGLIGDLFAGLANHPINQDGPNPASPLFNQAADGQAQQIQQMPAWERVAKSIWDNTLGGYIHTWQTNPAAAVAETGIGLGLLAATAVAPELAPIIWGGAALLAAPTILPGTVRSLADAWHNPNDQTITAAIINVGTAAVTIGSPMKAFRGVSTARSIAEAQAAMVSNIARPGSLARQVMGLSEKASQPGTLTDVRTLVDPTGGVEQYQLVPQTLAEFDAEIAKRSGGQAPIITDESVDRLRQLMDVHGQQMRRVQQSTDAQTLAEAKRVKDALEQEELVPALRDFSARYGYVLAKEQRMPRMTPEMVAQVPGGVKAAIDQRMRGIMGILHGAGEGHGWDGVSDGVVHTQLAENLSEAMARGQAGGGLEHATRQVEQLFREATRRAGVDDASLENIYRAIEGDPGHNVPEHYWSSLSSTHKYLAEWMHNAFGVMTNYAYKHGHVELPLQRYVPRIRQRSPDVGAEVPIKTSDHFLRNPGNVESRSWIADDWNRVQAMTDEEFHTDHDLGLRPLADRLRQQVLSRGDFTQREAERSAAWQATQPMRNLLRDPAVNQVVRESRRTYGQLTKDLLPSTQRKLDESQATVADLQTKIDQANARIADLARQETALKGKHGKAAQRAQLARIRTEVTDQLRTHTRALEGLRRQREGWQGKLVEYETRAAKVVSDLEQHAGEHAQRLLDEEDLSKLMGMPVGGRKLLSGVDLFHVQAGRFLRQMNETRYREAWGSIAQTRNPEHVRLAYGAGRPMSVAEINFKDLDQRPIAVTDELPPGDPGRQMLNGYEEVMPARGQPGAVNHQPAIYARADIAGKYKAWAQRARSASELHTAFARSVYGLTVGAPKRLIMGSPAWHGKNVAGRFMAMVAQHPAAAPHALFQVLKDRFTDPEKYYQTMMDYWQDGGVPANKFNVHEAVNHLEQQATGQRGFGWAMRTAGLGPLNHGHAKLAEGWFWKTINDVGAAAYLVAKHRMMQRPGTNERVAGMLAAEYANNIAGMVNPLYMSKLWRTGRQLAFFAPNWWTSYVRMAAQSVPGASRISHWLSRHPALRAMDPVKMHSLDIRQRKELVRMNRGYFLTYMAAGLAMHDLMNVVFSGHHVWDNAKGKTWDLQFDLSQPAQGDPQTQGVKHATVSGDPLFAQMADTMNVIGLGHDWGFFHQLTDPNLQKVDALHRLGLLVGALGTGLRNQGASKTGMPVQEGVGLGLGMDPYSLIRNGEVKQIPRTEALAGLLPAGTQAQVAMDDQRRLQTRLQITGDSKSLQQLQQLQSQGELPGGVPVKPLVGALRNQFLGLPSLYYTGDEPAQGTHFLSDPEMTQYLQSRQQILARKKVLSEQLFNGQLSPYDWVRQNGIESAKHTQLLADTFGQQSAQGQLWQAYDALGKKYALDDPNLSQAEYYNRLDQFNADWQNQLNAMSPTARAAWWDAHTAMWTDADYLHWMATQVKDAVAASIDGEGGAHIRQAQKELSSQGLPLTSTALDQLRQKDPYLWSYYAVLKEMGKSSLLGSVTSAFSNPFAAFTVVPDEQASALPALEAAGQLQSGTYAKQSTMQQLGQVAAAEGQATAQVAGQYPQTPEGQAFGRTSVAQAAQAILAQSTTTLSPQVIVELQRLAANG